MTWPEAKQHADRIMQTLRSQFPPDAVRLILRALQRNYQKRKHMELCKEEKLMEDIDLSSEYRAFAQAADALHRKIVERAKVREYNLAGAVEAISNTDRIGFAEICVRTLPMQDGLSAEYGLGPCLTPEVALFLIARECGGMFPQANA